MRRMQIVAAAAAALAALCLLHSCIMTVDAHAALTWPPSNRQNSSLADAGACVNADCRWFTNIVHIPGIPTLNASQYRTYNVDDASGTETDWSARNPWRAPGSAPVYGSGCGVAGGSNVVLFNGGISPAGIPQGMDGVQLPQQEAYVWKAGSVQEVGFAILANHGGGYSYRLCPLGPNGDTSQVSEECFQKFPLQFAGQQQWIQFGDVMPGQPRYELPPMVIVDQGTTPAGSQWARNPIPACYLCEQTSCGFDQLMPDWTDPSGTMAWGNETVEYYGGASWINQTHCGVVCAGELLTTNYAANGSHTGGQLCPPGNTQFLEPLPGISGFTVNHTFPERSVTAYSIIDRVVVPTDLVPGRYLLSWRWDCEQSPQVWQNCADIEVTITDDKADGEQDTIKLAGNDLRSQTKRRGMDNSESLWEAKESLEI